MNFTTNEPMKHLGRVLHCDYLREAIVDRFLERGRVLRLDGPSHCRHVDQAGLAFELSANHRQQFPGQTGRSFRNPHLRFELSFRGH